MSERHRADVAVIGAGIVGLATAWSLARSHPSLSLIVLDKEPEIATHQTGRNSGVIHAGLYYAPGSLKAKLSVEGGRRLLEFCADRGIPTTQTGKLVLATNEAQIPALDELERRAAANGVTSQRVGPAGIRDHEQHASGIDALWVPFTGAVDFAQVASVMAADLRDSGASIVTNAGVTAVSRRSEITVLETAAGDVEARLIVNCAGLHVDRVAHMLGVDPDLQILPFRGEYFSLTDEGAAMIRGHLYPVPDPRFPHLGVHFTRDVAGAVEVGPNAVWAWGREAYGRISGRPVDALETLRYRGFWNLARKHWKTGAGEQWRSLNKGAFVRTARAMLPPLEVAHLDKWRAGIRAQAVDRAGNLIHDFVITDGPGSVNVLNAPSPAATACLTIGEHIAKRAVAQL